MPQKCPQNENKTWDKFETTLPIFGQVGEFPQYPLYDGLYRGYVEISSTW
jgi:hypothetical protein